MSFTKSKIVKLAFGQIGLADYMYDLDGGQVDEAYDLLDAMVAGWEANGVRIGWPTNPGGSKLQPSAADLDDILLVSQTLAVGMVPSVGPDAELQVPDYALEALVSNLAVRLANTLGKQPPPGLLQTASVSLGNLANQTAVPTPQRELPSTTPLGQGNKPWRNFNNPFVREVPQGILAGTDNVLEFTE